MDGSSLDSKTSLAAPAANRSTAEKGKECEFSNTRIKITRRRKMSDRNNGNWSVLAAPVQASDLGLDCFSTPLVKLVIDYVWPTVYYRFNMDNKHMECFSHGWQLGWSELPYLALAQRGGRGGANAEKT
jgi:hypothetical protein